MILQNLHHLLGSIYDQILELKTVRLDVVDFQALPSPLLAVPAECRGAPA